MCIYTHTHTLICVYVSAYTYTHTYVYLCICVSIYLYMCRCAYTHTLIRQTKYVCIYTHTHTLIRVLRLLLCICACANNWRAPAYQLESSLAHAPGTWCLIKDHNACYAEQRSKRRGQALVALSVVLLLCSCVTWLKLDISSLVLMVLMLHGSIKLKLDISYSITW